MEVLKRVGVLSLALALFAAQRSGDLQSGEAAMLAAFIHRGLAQARTDFVALRGRRHASWQYGSIETFGASFERCNIDLDDDTNDWGLECTAVEHAVPAARLREAVVAAVTADLPSAFSISRGRSDSQPDVTWTGSGIYAGIYVWMYAQSVTQSGAPNHSWYVITVSHRH